MGELAELAKLNVQAPVYLRAAWELNGPVQSGLAQTAAEIHRLVQEHAKEWEALLGYFGESEILNFKQAG